MSEPLRQHPLLHPASWILELVGVVIVAGQILQFVQIDNIWFRLGADVIVLVGISLPFIYRWQRHRQQVALNHWAQAAPDLQGFVLYLRPFVTSGHLLVRCSVKSVRERYLYGIRWDLELALHEANPQRDLVAIGDVKNAYGAAKLSTTDAQWKAVLDGLARRAALIVIVPLPRPSTLWEFATVLGTPEFVRKTLVVMPPSFFWPTVRGWLLRRASVASQWRRSAANLLAQGIVLPAYRRKGMLLAPDAGKLIPIDAWKFQPDYLHALFNAAVGATGRGEPIVAAVEAAAKSPGVRRRRFLLINRSYSIFAVALVLALLFRSFAFQLFSVPTASEQPNLAIGDFFVANKFDWGVGTHTTPFTLSLDAPWGQLRAPQRGDIAVFYNAPTGETYVKRIIALPNDIVQMHAGRLYLNGALVEREQIGTATDTDSYGETVPVMRYRETLPGGRSYVVQEINDTSALDNTPAYSIGAGCYFVMGDNRDRSADSRVLKQVGCVAAENLIGQASLRYFSIDPGVAWWQVWQWPTHVRWDRVMRWVQ